MRVGVILLPQERWASQQQRWQQAEQWGFAHAWTYDHLSWRSLVEEPWFATVPLLAAAAAVTERIELGTWVASPNFRHPVPFAKDVMGLDDIAGGRFVLGLGAGGEGFDASVLGQSLSRAERTRRFAEFVGLLDQLLTSPVTDAAGEFFTAHQARMVPGTIARPRVPFVIAAAGPRAMELAARNGDGWVTFGAVGGTSDDGDEVGIADQQEAWWRGVEAQAIAMTATVERLGVAGPRRRYLHLDGGPVFSLESEATAREMIDRAATLGFTDVVVHWPRADGIYAGRVDVLESLAAELDGWRLLPPGA